LRKRFVVARFIAPALATALQTAACMGAQTTRSLPVAYDVDVVVAGGSGGAVAAAIRSARLYTDFPSSRVNCALALTSSKNHGNMPTMTPSVDLMFSKANLNAARTVCWFEQ